MENVLLASICTQKHFTNNTCSKFSDPPVSKYNLKLCFMPNIQMYKEPKLVQREEVNAWYTERLPRRKKYFTTG
jgi:hypothetical protein